MNRDKNIEKFLQKFDEMLKAANDIDGFKWNIKVSITTDNAIINDRIKTINGINESFTRNNMTWTSSNS